MRSLVKMGSSIQEIEKRTTATIVALPPVQWQVHPARPITELANPRMNPKPRPPPVLSRKPGPNPPAGYLVTSACTTKAADWDPYSAGPNQHRDKKVKASRWKAPVHI